MGHSPAPTHIAYRVSRIAYRVPASRPSDPANGVVDERIAAIWGASFLFMRMGAPAFGVVPPIALRVARVERGASRTSPRARTMLRSTRLAFRPVRDKE